MVTTIATGDTSVHRAEGRLPITLWATKSNNLLVLFIIWRWHKNLYAFNRTSRLDKAAGRELGHITPLVAATTGLGHVIPVNLACVRCCIHDSRGVRRRGLKRGHRHMKLHVERYRRCDLRP